MFGINGGELVVILLVAVIVIGPERLPTYAEQLGSLVRRARVALTDARSKVDAELGDEFRDVDWSTLDPRQYDPRRIVREAFLDDPAAGSRTSGAAGSGGADSGGEPFPRQPFDGESPAPFDDEAT